MEKQTISFEKALKMTQKYIADNYSTSLQQIKNNSYQEKDKFLREKLISYIDKYIEDENIEVIGYEKDKLAHTIYGEMSGYSILDEYLSDVNMEEINILSWKDIELSYDDGKVEKAKRHFLSREHCSDIMTKLLEKSKMTINKATPIVIGHIRNNVRITAFGEGVFEEELGIGASVRIVNPKKFKKEDFIKLGEANDVMLDFLTESYINGISLCILGSTGSGKTTLMSYIMSNIPNDKRLITLEENTREYDLHQYDENKYMTNNVIHLITRESDEEKQNITLAKLVKTALTCDPDYLCVSEMKGDESMQAVAAANTGHAVITTTHAPSCIKCYYRMLDLCKRSLKNDINTEILMRMITEAFPIVARIKKYKDNIRRIAEICECTGIDNNYNPIVIPLYKYQIEENHYDKNGKVSVIGHFEKVNTPSDAIKDIFFENGADEKTMNKYFKKGK